MFCDADKSMDVGGGSLPDTINPNNFPAKLWRLVNNPANKAINWDSQGEVIVINQHLFESELLSPNTILSDSADAFKTTNFSSFVRQLNLYGFRKADSASKDSLHPAGDSGTYHHFYNPNFKRSHPELVASLRRLTADNKAKLQAGQNVNCRPPSRHRYSGGDDGRDKNVKRGSSSLLSPTHQESTHPYLSTKTQAMTAYNGTPVPPRYLIRGHGTALSPTVFARDRGMPVSLSHLYSGVASSVNAVHVQQGFLARANHGNPNFTTFSPPHAQYSPGYCGSGCTYYQPNLVAPHLTGTELQTGSFSPHGYYQARYPVNMWCHGDYNQNSENKEHQEVKKCDVNLDTVFQIADEVMQTSPSNRLIRVVTPEKPRPELVPFSSTCHTMLCDKPASTMQANPLSAQPILMAVSGNASVVPYKQQEESMLLVPEQMPEDAIIEVTSDDAKVSDTLSDTSQP